MKLSDFFGIFKTSQAEFLAAENPHSDYYVIRLKPAADLTWMAGEHAIFSLPDQPVEGKKWRAFSVASTLDEGVITLGMRTGKDISSFKQVLINLQPGAGVKVRGPFGWFKVRDSHSPMVLIASGVGITPIRALLKELASDTARPLHLVYGAAEHHLFGDELLAIAEHNAALNLNLTDNRAATTAAYLDLAKQYGNEAYYYISGSQPAIAAITKELKSAGIKGRRTINDPFIGY